MKKRLHKEMTKDTAYRIEKTIFVPMKYDPKFDKYVPDKSKKRVVKTEKIYFDKPKR